MELISRKMAIDHIRVLGGEDRERLIGILSNKEILPTIESRPKGKWKIEEGSIPLCCECSICGWIISAGENEENNYCPHCGADMRGEE